MNLQANLNPWAEPGPDLELASCTRCKRTSHSLTSFGWCPWCDTAHKPAAPRLTTMIGGREYLVPGVD